MQESVSLTDEQFRSAYQQAFQTWARLHCGNAQEIGLPSQAFSSILELTNGHPILPRQLQLSQNSFGVYAKGTSIWGSTKADCPSGIPQFHQTLEVEVGTTEPTALSISSNDADKSPHKHPFRRDDNYLAILILAWTYILSARWAETMSGSCTMSYTEAKSASLEDLSEQNDNEGVFEISLENAGIQEARWWAAILALGQGWHARMESGHKTYMSPWSVILQSQCRFTLVHTAGRLPSDYPPASF